MTTLKDSLGMGNHFVCLRYMKSEANTRKIVDNTRMQALMIVHHMKKFMSVRILMMFSVVSLSTPFLPG